MSEWTGTWIADRMRAHTEVSAASVVAPQLVELRRKLYPAIIVGTTAVDRVDASVLRPLLDGSPAASFVVNIPKESYITGAALRLGAARGVPVGGVGDLMRAASLADVSTYVNKEIALVERGLSQHSRVIEFERVHDRLYSVKRRGLDDVVVVFLNEYDLTADQVRTARTRYGQFQMLVITNPNGGATTSAVAAADSIGSGIYKWGEFLGALNRP